MKGNHDVDLHRIGREGYFAFVREKNPGALESQWIPMDEELWKVEKYPAFLKARRNLLAEAADLHLTTLYPEHAVVLDAADGWRRVPVPLTSRPHISSVVEEEVLEELQDWLSGRELAPGESGYELRDTVADQAKATIDLAWPRGLPEGRGRPVALLLNESAETYRTVSQAGFDCHTSVEAFKQYVDAEIVGEVDVAAP